MSDLREVLQENSYLRQKQLIFADCDRYQRARVSTLLSIAAAVAGADYDARGLTYEKLYEMREVFLLSRIALRIHRCPRALQVVDVTTWEDGVKAAHMQRVYEITDREGLLVSIRSDWILVDPQTAHHAARHLHSQEAGHLPQGHRRSGAPEDPAAPGGG